MEALFGCFGALLRSLLFYTVFYAIGNVALKVLTLGRYPRLDHLRRHARQGFPEFELVAFVGLLCVIGLALLIARLA
ncbi:hypothetical protein [Herbaspirillum robiniae]|uniref:Uncharacterized protein n=1 Tax=Herbaspirillum robiniae TaxID=2014887 RepID=A0A2D0B6I7_9BURK|nr:hypothetical protein [Herbaspirillum robiniae]OWY29933.1 hypothetical protein CEJ42_08780 [Herbaspirillum robiniae]